jgi:hypothetical protein
MDNIITLKTVDDLLEYQFLVPDYQRGYRWTDTQVTDLLNDLWEFNCKEKSKDEFYCLQPVVVAKRDVEDRVVWELIDGQQRLTTIYIILSYFNKRFSEDFRTSIYKLEYQTRKDSGKYLSDINDEERDKNIDYYHFHGALSAVMNWFKGKTSYINAMESVLLTATKVIWYQVNEDDTMPVDIFTRINIGKIPLTNAELVKALFLQRCNFMREKASLKQLQIASEWDGIETVLQDDSFWCFIFNPGSRRRYETRIEYIFDLMKKKRHDSEYYFTYNEFHADFIKSREGCGAPDIDGIWQEVKNYFLTLHGWYKERKLYHLIGFLVDCGHNINNLKESSASRSKTEFLAHITELIKKQVDCQLQDLSYGDKRVKKVLLLFNIQTMLATRKGDTRFPFDKYKNEQWDIEHVCSQTDKQIAPNTRKDWTLDMLAYFTGEYGYSDDVVPGANKTKKDIQKDAIGRLSEERHQQYCHRLTKMLDADKFDDQPFYKLFDDMAEEFQEKKITEKDGISNLALLDAATNRSYKNAMFPIKRKTIIENDMNGIFIPICTKNLFLKFYSKQMGNVMYWHDSDAGNYLKAMRETLAEYLPPQRDVNE